jgi:hypothetical protein
MVRWITKDSPGYVGEMDKHRRYQEYHSRFNDPIRKAGPMTYNDYIEVVKQAPQKAVNIFTQYRDQRQALEDNHLIPDSGKVIEGGRLRQEAHNKVQQLRETAAVAADLAEKKLAHDRDAARPKVDADIWSRKARQFAYLVDRGVDPESLAGEIVDAVSLRVAQDELPILARGQSPLDPQAGEAVAAKLAHKANSIYSDTFQERAEALAQFQRGAYRANVALSATLRQLREDDRGDLSVPAFAEGQLIEA